MKTLSEIKDLFVSARELARVASPADAKVAAEKLKGISEHCKELYATSDSYLERAKCRNLFESIDNIIDVLGMYGFVDLRVAAFFGLAEAGRGAPSFADISSGRGTVEKPVAPVKPVEPILEESAPAEKTPARRTPPPPPAETPKQSDTDPVPEAPVPADASASEPADPVEADEAEPVVPAAEGEAVPEEDGRPLEERLEPQSLDDFVGQEHVVRRLKAEIAAAGKKGVQHLDHIMLFGNRGLGKSTLMKLIAKELGVAFEFIDCSTLMNDVKSQRLFHEFFLSIADRNEPVVIALDEIHALPGRLQTSLLTLLAERRYSYLTESGTKNVPMPEFTFIGATTDYDKLLVTLRDRASNLTFVLKDYTRAQLSTIFHKKLAALGFSADESVVQECINRCRSSIRDVTSIVKGLQTKAINADAKVISAEMATAYFAERELDAIGLGPIDRDILRIIREEPHGVISAETLAARLYIDPAALASTYEPYLLKIGFISINSRGRSLTPKAEDYLHYGYFDFGEGVTVGEKPAGT